LLGIVRYLVLPGFFQEDAVNQMLSRAKELIKEVDLATHPMVNGGISKAMSSSFRT
jgi:hypothetical protein